MGDALGLDGNGEGAELHVARHAAHHRGCEVNADNRFFTCFEVEHGLVDGEGRVDRDGDELAATLVDEEQLSEGGLANEGRRERELRRRNHQHRGASLGHAGLTPARADQQRQAELSDDIPQVNGPHLFPDGCGTNEIARRLNRAGASRATAPP